MRVSTLFLVAAIALAGCGKPITAANAAPEQAAILANRTDARAGLEYQRTRLETDQLPIGLDQADLAVVASKYRALAGRISQRSKPLPGLRDFATRMEFVLDFDRAMVNGQPAGAATLTAVVGEFQSNFKRSAAAADALLGRLPGAEPDDNLVWNPHVGRN